MDVVDLYTMIPQAEGVLALKKMLDYLEVRQLDGLNTETILRLSRFVMQNNFFSYEGQFYRQVRGGAMGSPLTLTVANWYMFFFEGNIVKQIANAGGLYVRYIDDIFIATNWPERHLSKQIDRWNFLDSNIKLNTQIGSSIDFLDLHLEITDGKLHTSVYHKPSHEPYYLPFHSVHPMHMKKNVPFAMLLRAVEYCSTFESYVTEREQLRMALLLNKYPDTFVNKQFKRVFQQHDVTDSPTAFSYYDIRKKILEAPPTAKIRIDYSKTMFVHFTYCLNMKSFPVKFHSLWQKFFGESPINEVKPILGTRNADNLQLQLVKNKERKRRTNQIGNEKMARADIVEQVLPIEFGIEPVANPSDV